MNILNSNDYMILACIRDTENNIGLCEARGMTKIMIKERTELSISTVNRSINKLLEAGFINNAIKEINKKTYYINKIGTNRLLEVYNIKINEESVGDE